MANDPGRPRRPMGTLERAEAAFKAATTPAAPAVAAGHSIPNPKETISLRIDSDVLAAFQDDGPGWQERINAALRKAAGL